MSKDFTYKCTRLEGSDKQGVLKPDNNGFYTICLGALNHHSQNTYIENGRIQQVYYSAEGAEKFFNEGTVFNRRIKGGFVRSEYGHPKRDGMSSQEYLERNLNIDERMVCATISEVWLVPDYIDPLTKERCIAIMGKVKPSGPYGKYLKEDLESPGINACFSIRALSSWKVINGKKSKVLHSIVTFDYVNEPGITCAEKLVSPSLENKQETIIADVEFNPAMANKVLNQSNITSNESSLGIMKEALDDYNRYNKKEFKGNTFNF